MNVDATRSLIARAKDITLLSTAFGVPLVFFGTLEDEPFNITKLSLLLAGVSCALALHLVHMSMGHRTRGLREILVPVLGLTVPLLLSWAASPYRGWALFGQFSRFTGLLPYVAFGVLAILLVDAFWERRHVLAWGLALVGSVVGGYALLQSLGLDPLWSPGIDAGSPYPPSTVGHNNFAGGFLGICLPVAVHLWLHSSRSWVAMSSTVAITTGLLMTNSQGGWLASIVGLSIVVGDALAQRWSVAVVLGRVAALGAVVVVLLGVAISTVADDPPLGATAKSRGLYWAAALEMGSDSPVVGTGPATFAVEGSRYRPLTHWLLELNQGVDDPHSVPLAFWANAGALGLLGVLVVVIWIIRTGSRENGGGGIEVAFFAAGAAYLAQSVVSIDEPTLRAALSVCLAGLALSIASRSSPPLDRTPRAPFVAGAVIVSLGLSGAGLWYVFGLMSAHRGVVDAKARFNDGNPVAGQERFEDAVAFRFEPHYLASYASELGREGLRQAVDGGPFIDRMGEVNGYLVSFPQPAALLDAAQIYLYWGHFDRSGLQDAEAILRKAKLLVPENFEVDIKMSQVQLAQGDPQTALDHLEGWVGKIDLPDFWASLATARWAAGDTGGAEAALERAMQLGPLRCRVLVARGAIAWSDQQALEHEVASGLGFNCPAGDSAYMKDLIERYAV